MHDIPDNNIVNQGKLYYYVAQDGLDQQDLINAGQVFLMNCTNTHVSNLDISGTYAGMVIFGGENITITGTHLHDNHKYGMALYWDPTRLWIPEFNQVSGCLIHNNTVGLALLGMNNVTIHDCIIEENDEDGIFAFAAMNNTVTNCTIRHNQRGIFTFWSPGMRIQESTITNNEEGILLAFNSGKCIAERNIVAHNEKSGILLEDCPDGMFSFNNISFNGEFGIYLSMSSTNNLIYSNFFIMNGASEALSYDGTSSWDNGTTGNYWSDYELLYPSATRAGATWDTPYKINGTDSTFDNFPVYFNTMPAASFVINATVILEGWRASCSFNG
nr:NosD domain-containing protein [Candidatus Sigynarchaeota archaeon]